MVVNLPLPLEIPAILRLFGIAVTIDPARTWLEAAAISVTLFVILFFVRQRPVAMMLAEDGILFRAGVRDLHDVQAVTAEDHTAVAPPRGAKPLVLARFADLVAEVGGIDGVQVHRSAWVAAASVDGAIREGRAWRLVLARRHTLAGQREPCRRSADSRLAQNKTQGRGSVTLRHPGKGWAPASSKDQAPPFMRIAIASDHAAVALKATLGEWLRDAGHEVADLGPHDTASVDYPDYGYKLAQAIASGQADRGVALCGSGIGISIAVNRGPRLPLRAGQRTALRRARPRA